jgi:hypothetical protein
MASATFHLVEAPDLNINKKKKKWIYFIFSQYWSYFQQDLLTLILEY